MTVRYSKIFTVIGAITNEPVTILVERIEAEGFQEVTIESLEGTYHSTKDFKKETDARNGKIYTFLPLKPIDIRQLADTLNEALAASSGA